MKTKLFSLFGLVVILGVIGYYYRVNFPVKTELPNPMAPQDEQVNQSQETDPLTFLIDRIHKPVRGEVIRPQTTAELRAWFAESDITRSVPRVFVEQFPDDFHTQGDKELFAKVIASLILRSNEQITKEKVVLALLKNKNERGEVWTEKEKEVFNELVKKYDSKARKTISAQLADLTPKIDVIPPLAAILQAAEATNWGHDHFESPYEQTGWLDAKTYTRVPFTSLIEATDSYAREMNGMPPLTDWRYARSSLKARGHEDLGARILRWLNDYKMEDLAYSDKLEARLKELEYEIPDNLRFSKLPMISFEKGSLTLNGQVFSVEIARTLEQKQHGLMYRSAVPEKTGMLFYHDQLIPTTIWMKNTFIPLDIVFFDADNKVVQIMENVPALDETRRSSEMPVKGFVEFPAGTVQQYQIRIGNRLELPQ